MSATAIASAPRRDLLDVVNDPSARLAVLGASRDPNAKFTVLVLGGESPRSARAAIKVPTTARAADSVARERRVLDALHRLGSEVIDSTAPRVLDVITAGGHEAVVLSALPGTPMATRYLRWRHTRSRLRVARDLGAISDWLARLHAETAADPAPVQMDAGVVEALVERHGRGGRQRARTLDMVASACARLGDHRSPRTVVHGDLWCGNVLVGDDGRVSGVIDWEDAALAGEPLRDLARFALTYALYLDRHSRPGRHVRGHPGLRADAWGSGIDYLLFGSGWICDLLRAFLRLGMRRLGVPGDLWRESVIAGVAEVAARTDHEAFGRSHLQVLDRIAAAPGGP